MITACYSGIIVRFKSTPVILNFNLTYVKLETEINFQNAVTFVAV